MRRKEEALRDTLLATARAMIDADGPNAISIRRLADGACVAVGTVYNYFTSKDDLLFTLAEEYWKKAYSSLPDAPDAAGFTAQVAKIYTFLCACMEDSVGSLMRGLRGASSEGKARMAATQRLLNSTLERLLLADPHISPDVWTPSLSPRQMAGFVQLILFSYLSQKADSIDVFLDILQRVLYATQGGNRHGAGNL